jgi:hypothetical protein
MRSVRADSEKGQSLSRICNPREFLFIYENTKHHKLSSLRYFGMGGLLVRYMGHLVSGRWDTLCPVDETLCSMVAGTPCSPVDGTPCSPVDGTPCSPVDGTLCSTVDGTPCIPVDGTPCSPVDGTSCSPVDGTPFSPVVGNTPLVEYTASIFLYTDNKTTILLRNLCTLHGITNVLGTSNLVSQSQDCVFSTQVKLFYISKGRSAK